MRHEGRSLVRSENAVHRALTARRRREVSSGRVASRATHRRARTSGRSAGTHTPRSAAVTDGRCEPSASLSGRLPRQHLRPEDHPSRAASRPRRSALTRRAARAGRPCRGSRRRPVERLHPVVASELCSHASGPLDPGRACDLISQACRDLRHLHHSDPLHLDIRPADILMADASPRRPRSRERADRSTTGGCVQGGAERRA